MKTKSEFIEEFIFIAFLLALDLMTAVGGIRFLYRHQYFYGICCLIISMISMRKHYEYVEETFD